MRDLMNHIHVKAGAAPVVATDNTPVVSAIIDTQGYQSLAFIILTGTLADSDATFTTLVEHDDASGFGTKVAVPDKDLLGTEALASFATADDGEPRKIGYVGSKRYVRLTVTPAANSGNAPLAIAALLGHPDVGPTDNPPA